MNAIDKYFCGTIAILSLSVSAASADTYSGNGNTSFGGQLGNSTLTVTDDPNARTVTFSLATPGLGNDAVFYFATGQANGVNTTANVTGNTGDGGNRAVTGMDDYHRTIINFAENFNANYGLDLNGTGNYATL